MKDPSSHNLERNKKDQLDESGPPYIPLWTIMQILGGASYT